MNNVPTCYVTDAGVVLKPSPLLLEIMIYRTHGEHANLYNADVIRTW